MHRNEILRRGRSWDVYLHLLFPICTNVEAQNKGFSLDFVESPLFDLQSPGC